MAFQRVGFCRHLGVGARELPAWTVIVDHQVVDAQNARVAHDLAADMLDEFGIGRLTQKRTHRILDELKTAPANIGTDGKSNPSIEVDTRHLRNNCAHQHGARGKDIVLGILGGRMQRLGLNTVT